MDNPNDHEDEQIDLEAEFEAAWMDMHEGRTQPIDDLWDEIDDDEPSKEEILANLREAMIDALKGNTLPLSALDELDDDGDDDQSK